MVAIKPLRYILLLCFLFILSIPQHAFAHAVLEKAVPAQNSQLQSSPNEIVLKFNERLEKELYSIKVFNQDGDEVSETKGMLSADQKQLTYKLPKLANGYYTISYSVISADGHPVKGSYMFSVGNGPVEKNKSAPIQQEDQDSFLISAVRIIYFITMLLATGWILWGSFHRFKDSEDLRQSYQKWADYLQIALFIAHIGMGAILAAGSLEQWSLNSLMELITGTATGNAWLISLIVMLLGFGHLPRGDWFDRIWVFLLLGAKSMNGHAFAYEPRSLTVSLDFIHLLAASIWAGGLLYIILYFKRYPDQTRGFLVKFSKAALISMLVLIATGMASTLIYLPKISYLFVTKWGIFLVVKVVLVLFVIIVAGFLRFYLKKNNETAIRKLVKVDFGLMISILVIVGIFTYLSPVPENKPLNWHEKGDEIEFTANISPKVPGTNVFVVDAETHEERLVIKRIELNLIYKDNKEVAPIRVPLEAYQQGKKAHFMIDGKYLPFPGNWTAEVRILDSEDNEKVFQKDFIVY